MQKDYNVGTKPGYAQILIASSVGLMFAAAMHYRLKKIRDNRIIPGIRISESGQLIKLEKFSYYLATKECPNLCKLASDYIRKSDGCEEDMYNFFVNKQEADSLFIKLVEEFERCILSYFAFHWSQAPYMIRQVHQSSTDAASSLLVTALNEGQDVIMDGTVFWVPFVVQTITMARNVHRRRYRMEAGYKADKDGVLTENYWEQIDEEQVEPKREDHTG